MLTDTAPVRYTRPTRRRVGIHAGIAAYQLWAGYAVSRVLAPVLGSRSDGLCPEGVQRHVFDPLICVPYEDLMTEYWLS